MAYSSKSQYRLNDSRSSKIYRGKNPQLIVILLSSKVVETSNQSHGYNALHNNVVYVEHYATTKTLCVYDQA